MFTRSYVEFIKIVLLSTPAFIMFLGVIFITSRYKSDESWGQERVAAAGEVVGQQSAPDIGQQHLVTQSMSNLTQELSVPKFVHLIWFYPKDTNFKFHHLMCLLSVQRRLIPKRVIFWYNNDPQGPWWAFARKILPNMALMYTDPPMEIFGRPVLRPEHQSDITRLDVLIKYGGIYLDLDVIVLKGFDSLLSHEVTLGAETPDLLGNGIILAQANATFLRLWKEQYKDFDDSQWNQHSVKLPMQLAHRHPGLIHIEWFSLLRPNWFEKSWIFEPGKLWDWSDNYAIHLYYRYHGLDHDPVSIRALNSTFGEIMRLIYYGSANLLPPA